LVSLPACDALLFDLDGTLIDSRRDIAEAMNAMLVLHGRAPLAFEDVLPLIGDGARALVARALRRSGLEDLAEERERSALADFKRLYAERPCVHTTLMPGAEAALAIGPPCGIVTNKPREVTTLVIEALGIGKKIRALWAGDGALKPAPEGVLAVAKALGVKPERAWMIGDGPQDILAGKAAGVFTVAVPGIAEREAVLAAKPDLVLDSLLDLPARATER
jgi:phosphoglycolate phosphatase